MQVRPAADMQTSGVVKHARFRGQVRDLVWKNLLLKRRSWSSTLLEIVIPIVFLALVLFIRSLIKKGEIPASLNMEPNQISRFDPVQQQTKLLKSLSGRIIAIVPASGVAFTVADALRARIPAASNRIKTLASNTDMENYISNVNYGTDKNPEIFAAIVFTSDSPSYSYTIRMNATSRREETVNYRPGSNVNTLDPRYDRSQQRYADNGFMFFQTLVDSVIISGAANATVPFIAQPYPTRTFTSDNFAAFAGSLIPIMIAFGYMYTSTRVSKSLMEEKELKITEGLMAIGVSSSAIFVSWFIIYAAIYGIQAGLITLIVKKGMYTFSNGFIVWLVYWLFAMSSMFALAFLVTPFFSRQRIASIFTALALLIMTFIYFSVNSDDTPKANKTLSSLLSPVAFCHALNVLTTFDSYGKGVQFGNFNETLNNADVLTSVLFMILDIGIYSVLGMYLSKVLPSQYGVAEPWNFFMQKSFWFPSETFPTAADTGVPGEALSKKDITGREVFEAPKGSHNIGVSIRKLRRSFNNGKTIAVNGISLDMYEGDIFCLLGHNGAGKTTTIQMLSGFLPAESGQANIYGHSILNEMKSIRQKMGYCPQHDTLYLEMTVQEHLMLFGSLKGVTSKLLASAVSEMIVSVGLEEKVHVRARNLSGGQKRKLSIGIAFIGDSKFIVLDEPTSGMDVYSMRSIWELIKRYRTGRTILLTTHFMDEADALSDRIGIMAHGELHCVGSSLFLKRLFGVGYTMTMGKTEAATEKTSRALIDLVKKRIPESEKLTDVAGEISFRLPLSQMKLFPDMFDEIDRLSAELAVASYGVSVTTLSEVFLRVGSAAVVNKQDSAKLIRDISAKSALTVPVPIKPLQEPRRMFIRHTIAMLWKRWHSAKRDLKVLVWQVLLPFVICLLGMILADSMFNFKFVPTTMSVASQYGPDIDIVYTSGTAAEGLNVTILNKLLPPSLATPAQVGSSATAELSAFLARTIDSDRTRPTYGAFCFDQTGFTILYNTSGYQSLPTYMNAFSNARLRQMTGMEQASITLTSQPLPFTVLQKSRNSTILALVFGIAFAFVPASYAAFIIRERETQVLHQQLISGVSTAAYWVSALIWDIVSMMVPIGLSLILILAFNIEPLIGSNFPGTLLGLFLFSCSVCPFTYLLSFFFKDANTGQNTLLFVNIISVTVLLLASVIMDIFTETKDANVYLVSIYYLLPPYAMARLIFNLLLRNTILNADNEIEAVFSMAIVGKPAVYMACEMVGYSILVLCVEYVLRTPALLKYLEGGVPVDNGQGKTDALDEDVAAEKTRIQRGDADQDPIIVRGLRKVYKVPDQGAKIAVRDQWFAIPRGQCFGFLGVNGAGKTTTLQMLTGDVIPTSGTATLVGLDINTQQATVRQYIGYCPQFDALIHLMTAREHLEMFAAIKGVDPAEMNSFVNRMIDKLGLTMYADLPCGGYSGGNRRKLSVGIALIGDPPVVFLDEPSTGMDPKSKRNMWDLICQTMTGKSVILTTHSMEECEALCSRVGIQVSGQLQCLGTPQHLKNRFGNGYQLDLISEAGKADQVKHFVEEGFPGAILLEQQNGNLRYRVPRGQTLSQMFRIVENGASATKLVDSYSISDISLEQIFLQFASKQEELHHAAPGIVLNVPDS